MRRVKFAALAAVGLLLTAGAAQAKDLLFSTGFLAYDSSETELDVSIHSSYVPSPADVPDTARVTLYDSTGAMIGTPTAVTITPGSANLTNFTLPALTPGDTDYIRADITCAKSKSCNKDRALISATIRGTKVRRASASLLK